MRDSLRGRKQHWQEWIDRWSKYSNKTTSSYLLTYLNWCKNLRRVGGRFGKSRIVIRAVQCFPASFCLWIAQCLSLHGWALDPHSDPGRWASIVIFFYPYKPPPHPDKPPARPTPKSLISVHFGSVWLRFGSFWLCLAVSGPFRVLFRVLGGVGLGSGRGASVREKNITKPASQPAHKNKKRAPHE